MPDAIGPMATVRRYADAFNKGDVKAMAAPTAGLPGFQIDFDFIDHLLYQLRHRVGRQ
jgi:hypothetical protein